MQYESSIVQKFFLRPWTNLLPWFGRTPSVFYVFLYRLHTYAVGSNYLGRHPILSYINCESSLICYCASGNCNQSWWNIFQLKMILLTSYNFHLKSFKNTQHCHRLQFLNANTRHRHFAVLYQRILFVTCSCFLDSFYLIVLFCAWYEFRILSFADVAKVYICCICICCLNLTCCLL